MTYKPSRELVKRFRELNFCYSWSSDRDSRSGHQVNMHLWRQRAMYEGGDCHLAGFVGAVPHQRLFPSRTMGGNPYLSVPAYGQRSQLLTTTNSAGEG